MNDFVSRGVCGAGQGTSSNKRMFFEQKSIGRRKLRQGRVMTDERKKLFAQGAVFHLFCLWKKTKFVLLYLNFALVFPETYEAPPCGVFAFLVAWFLRRIPPFAALTPIFSGADHRPSGSETGGGYCYKVENYLLT